MSKIVKYIPVKTVARVRKQRKPKRKPRGMGSTVTIGNGTRVAHRLDHVGFPKRMSMKMKYTSEPKTLTISLSQFYLINITDLFDPDRTGTGHQPMVFDQMSILYNNYRVNKFEYSLSMVNNSNAGPLRYSWGTNPGQTGPTTMQNSYESTGWRSGTGGSGAQPVVIKGTVRPWTALTITKARYMTENQYVNPVTSGATSIPTLQIYCEFMDPTATGTITFQFTTVYTADFFSPIYLGQS